VVGAATGHGDAERRTAADSVSKAAVLRPLTMLPLFLSHREAPGVPSNVRSAAPADDLRTSG